MKENLRPLKEVAEENATMRDFGVDLILLCSAGYTMEDFQAYVDEEMKDPDMRKAVEALTPLMKLAFEAHEEEKTEDEK